MNEFLMHNDPLANVILNVKVLILVYRACVRDYCTMT